MADLRRLKLLNFTRWNIRGTPFSSIGPISTLSTNCEIDNVDIAHKHLQPTGSLCMLYRFIERRSGVLKTNIITEYVLGCTRYQSV